ncbi:MFS transporter [Cohnella faecalis]|uniref:MFS transporter n=1 Tax=Cohnella faecalis TaxID=2315694 RepID=UPI001F348626|nr:MFS transporter [Cohnella faecalis]
MAGKGFLQAGHKPSLFSAFAYFDVSFMIWVLLGPLSIIIMKDFDLSAAQKANLVALPILGGSILRLVLGFLTDRIGPKRTAQLECLLHSFRSFGMQFAHTLSSLHYVAFCSASPERASPSLSRCQPLVPAAISRACHGHRRSRQ